MDAFTRIQAIWTKCAPLRRASRRAGEPMRRGLLCSTPTQLASPELGALHGQFWRLLTERTGAAMLALTAVSLEVTYAFQTDFRDSRSSVHRHDDLGRPCRRKVRNAANSARSLVWEPREDTPSNLPRREPTRVSGAGKWRSQCVDQDDRKGR